MNSYDLMSLEEKSTAFAGYVALAADSIETLRFCDTERVLSQARCYDELKALSDYLFTARPDFDVAEVCEIESEIALERGWERKRRWS